MPSKKQYNLVQNDDYDTRIPLHSEEAFQHGITFQAKYIGTMDVPRPKSRVEIVAAMRMIRYEFKAKGVKKKKVTLDISVDGVRVTLRKKKKKKQWMDDSNLTLMHHPIYRIFYVSHDSQDLKIFSYIARDGSSNVFKCNVFKSNKKSQAMRIVRTVGQAFEVCHKLTSSGSGSAGVGSPDDDEHDALTSGGGDADQPAGDRDPGAARKDALSDPVSCDTLEGTGHEDEVSVQSEPAPPSSTSAALGTASGGGGGGGATPVGVGARPQRLDILPPPPRSSNPRRTSPMSGGSGGGDAYSGGGGDSTAAGTPLSAQHELQMLREQLEQQVQQTQAAVAQAHLLRDQLAAETAARLEAQARTHQLLVHNKELLDHIAALVAALQDQERIHQQQQHNPHQYHHQQQQAQQQQQQQQQQQLHTPHVAMVPQLPLLYDYLSPAGDYQDAAAAAADAYLGGPGSRGSLLQAPPFASPFGYTQAEQQLLQRLQALSRYQQLLGYPSAATPAAPASPLFPHHYRLSQPPSYSGSPVLSHRQQQEQFRAHEGGSPPGTPPQFIRPLSQVGTLTTADSEGRLRVIVPVTTDDSSLPHRSGSGSPSPGGSGGGTSAMRHLASALAPLRVGEDGGGSVSSGRSGRPLANGPPSITRSTSEKVPNRSELMSQVQRTAWARHTTK